MRRHLIFRLFRPCIRGALLSLTLVGTLSVLHSISVVMTLSSIWQCILSVYDTVLAPELLKTISIFVISHALPYCGAKELTPYKC